MARREPSRGLHRRTKSWSVGGAPLDAAVQLGGVVLDPSIDRGVIDQEMALGHHLLEVAVDKSVEAIPAQAKEDVGRKMPAFERQTHASRPDCNHLRPKGSHPRSLFATDPSGAFNLNAPNEEAPLATTSRSNGNLFVGQLQQFPNVRGKLPSLVWPTFSTTPTTRPAVSITGPPDMPWLSSWETSIR